MVKDNIPDVNFSNFANLTNKNISFNFILLNLK